MTFIIILLIVFILFNLYNPEYIKNLLGQNINQENFNEKFVDQESLHSMKYERCCKQYGCETPICQHILRKRQSKTSNSINNNVVSTTRNFNVINNITDDTNEDGDFTLCYKDNEIPKYNDLIKDNSMSSVTPTQFYYPAINLDDYKKLGYIKNEYVNNNQKYVLYGKEIDNNKMDYVITNVNKKIMWNFTRNKYSNGDHLYLKKANRESGPYFIHLN